MRFTPFKTAFVGRIRCPHCRQWHAVFYGHTEGTDYTLQMLYFTCRGMRFYAGQAGQTSRHPTRPAER
jgi:hypothetical protein